MTIEEFTSRFEVAERQTDGSYMCRCPAHDDHNPSLHVSASEDGKILLKCYAGCSAESIVAAMGLKMSDLMPDDGKGRGKRSRSVSKASAKKAKTAAAPSGERDYGKLVAFYDYTDADGKVLYRVERRVRKDGKKTFIQKHPDPASPYGWSWGVSRAGIARVPFRLPRILEAAKGGKSVIICEGEKDVLSVEKFLKCAATCNAAGAGKWESGWGKYFEGVRTICIIADNDPLFVVDEKTGGEKPFAPGQRHACDVERKLRADGFKGGIHKMCMPQVEGQARVKDFTDWCEARTAAGLAVDKAAFQEAIEAFGEWPEEWNFGPDDETKSVESPSEETIEVGRFGTEDPRTPADGEKRYLVDFDIGNGGVVRLEFFYSRPVPDLVAYASMAVTKVLMKVDKSAKVPYARIKSFTIAVWLLMRGSFFWHAEKREFARCMYLDRDEGNCRLMLIESDEFYAFVAKHAELDDVDPKKGDLAKIMGFVKQIAISDDYSKGVLPSNLWDRRGDTAYISSGDTEMYRLRNGAIDKVQNGTDGVVFLRGKTLQPWRLLDGPGADPFSEALLFKAASWADDRGAMVMRCWVLNLFANHAAKPPLLLTGGAGSGKTRMAKGVKEILGVRTDGVLDLSVQQMEDGDKGLDAFWATVNEGRLEVFDNLDTRIKWAADTLQIAATDGQTKRRTLYTTYGVSTLRANAYLMFTSNNPVISTEGNGGMADRLITIRLVRNRHESMDKALSQDISSRRDEFMTWIARTVCAALADAEPVAQTVNTRHPDFGEFSIRVGRAIHAEKAVVEALGGVEMDKLLLPIQNDVVGCEILKVLGEKDYKWSFTSGEMSTAIIGSMGDDADEKTKTIYSSRKVGKAISRLNRQLSSILKWNGPRISEGRSVYDCHGLADGVTVDMVGFNGDFQKTREGADAHGFWRNNPPNPPNPPDAGGVSTRAQDDISSFMREEEEKDINREDEGNWYDDL